MKRLGVFGGTFDPVHWGHLTPALHACRVFDFDALLFVPAGRPPHKAGETITPFVHRFAMLALATHHLDRVTVSDVELEFDGPTFTIDVLARLRRRHNPRELFFLLGSDSLAQITTWHRWRELVDQVHLVVLHRPGFWGADLAALLPPTLHGRSEGVREGEVTPTSRGCPAVYLLEHEPVDACATELRRRVAAGGPIGDTVPEDVAHYVAKYGLYREGEGTHRGR